MKTFTIITEEGKLNHHYEILSIGTGEQNAFFTIYMRESETDDFLDEYFKGASGYKVQIDTDNFCLLIKNKCSVISMNYITSDNPGVVFTIMPEKELS